MTVIFRKHELLVAINNLEKEKRLFTTYDLIDEIDEKRPSSSGVVESVRMILQMVNLIKPINNQLNRAENQVEREERGIEMDPIIKQSHQPIVSISLDEDETSELSDQFETARNPLLREKGFSLDLAGYDEERERHMSTQSAGPSMSQPLKGIENREDRSFGLIEKKSASYPTITTKESRRSGKHSEQILNEINHHMGAVMQEHQIEDLHDKNLSLLVCYAFYGHENTWKLWEDCAAPLYSALLVVYVSETMWRRFDRIYESDVADIFEKQKKRFDELSKSLLDTYHSIDFQKTRRILFERYIPKKEMDSKGGTLLGLANMGNAENFFSQISCQRVVEDRWKPGFRCNKKTFFVMFLPFFGLPLLFSKRFVHFTGKSADYGLHRLWRFHSSPCGRFAWHTFFYWIYVVAFGVLIQKTHQIMSVVDVLTWMAFLMLGWQAMFFIEALAEYYFHNRSKQAFNSTLYDFFRTNHIVTVGHFVLILFNFILLIMALLIDSERQISIDSFISLDAENGTMTTMETILRSNQSEVENITAELSRIQTRSNAVNIRLILLSGSEVLFLISFIFSAIRILRVFTVDPFFGSIVMTIRKMVLLFAYFSVILVAFWIVYGVCQIALQGLKKQHSVFWQIFINGAFEIFGELEGEIKTGAIDGCGNETLTWENLTGQSLQCAVRSWLIPVVLFLYTITTSILVINILTTLINQMYEDMSDRAEQNWRSLRYRRMIEYETKMPFPPPLSPLNIIVFIWRWCYTNKRSEKEGKGPAMYYYCGEETEMIQIPKLDRSKTINSILSEDEPLDEDEGSLRKFEIRCKKVFLGESNQQQESHETLCLQCRQKIKKRTRKLSSTRFLVQ